MTALEKLSIEFAKGHATAGAAESAHFAAGVFYSYQEPIAALLSMRKAWVTTAKFSKTTSKHRAAVTHALHVQGYEIVESEVMPPPEGTKSAPIPALSLRDAEVVRDALGTYAIESSDPLVKARCRALRAVFDAAAEGDAEAAAGLYDAARVKGGC